MSYDFESDDHSPPRVPEGPQMRGDDLEAIVLLLELAAIQLSPSWSATFTFDELLAEARKIGGDIALDERDVRIVLPHMKTIKRARPGPARYCLT